MADHNGVIIVSSVDSTTQAYKLGVRPGMELLAWNTLPLKRKLAEMNIKRYLKSFPALKEDQIRLLLLCRGKQGERAEVYFLTHTGNTRGISLVAGR